MFYYDCQMLATLESESYTTAFQQEKLGEIIANTISIVRINGKLSVTTCFTYVKESLLTLFVFTALPLLVSRMIRLQVPSDP